MSDALLKDINMNVIREERKSSGGNTSDPLRFGVKTFQLCRPYEKLSRRCTDAAQNYSDFMIIFKC